MTNLQVHPKTLTPIWTGGIDQTCDRLHETGLIGSLRWWYEALVRGLGGYACDPTSEDRCEYDPKKPDPPEKQLCAACYLFGCTGWARKFRFRVSDGQRLFYGQNVLIPSERKHPTKEVGRAGGWFVFSESRVGEIAFDLIPLRDADLRPIHTILSLIDRHASLGPKGASGYGVIRAEDVVSALDWIERFDNRQHSRTNSLPDFRDLFFARFQFQESQNSGWWQQIEGIQQAVSGKLKDNSSPPPLRRAQEELQQMYAEGILPIAPVIRNWLHYQWQHGLSPVETHFVFGEAQAVCPNCYQPGFRPDRKEPNKNWCLHCKSPFNKGEEIATTASKIYVSYAYRLENGTWEFRIWGWLPCAGEIRERDKFLSSLKTAFQEGQIWQYVFGKSGITPKMVEWHARDHSQTDGRAYLELLGGAS
ncbi:MAG: type III-B CRISPR module RAMP protein Cmr1 [Anaerolineales bacterium]